MIAYTDASVILRIVLFAERRLPEWQTIEELVSSELAGTECRRTIQRLRSQNRLDDDATMEALSKAHELIADIDLIPVRTRVLTRAGDPFPGALGTLEAIHLATALLWQDDANRKLDAFLTHDVEWSAVTARSVRSERIRGRTSPKKAASMSSITCRLSSARPSWAGTSGPLMWTYSAS